MASDAILFDVAVLFLLLRLLLLFLLFAVDVDVVVVVDVVVATADVSFFLLLFAPIMTFVLLGVKLTLL